MQISSEWILKTIWSLRQERVFLPLCESDAHKETLSLPECWRTWLCAYFKFLEESSRKSLPVASPDAVGKSCSLSNLHFAYQSFTHSSFNSSLLVFLPCGIHFLFLFFFLFTDSFKQAANTYWLTKHKEQWQQQLVFTEFWGENANWLSEFSPCFPYSKMAVNRHVAKLHFPAFLAVTDDHVPPQHLGQGGGGRGGW